MLAISASNQVQKEKESGERVFLFLFFFLFLPLETSLLPHCYLDSSSDFEDPSRRIRGPIEEAKRRNRGENVIRHRFCLGRSQESEDSVTFLRNQAGVDIRFASPVTPVCSKFFDWCYEPKTQLKDRLSGFYKWFEENSELLLK